jgi:uncharacterized Zn finger protein (UPF0148 family)
MARGKLCPFCGTENTGGLPHRWHKMAHREKARLEQVAEMARQTVEVNRVRLVLADAVDEAREPDGWRPNQKRTAYHREYWSKNIERRREQSRLAKERMRMKRRLKPLIEHLCHAVDLGRESARW